jgi:hypothetical protein
MKAKPEPYLLNEIPPAWKCIMQYIKSPKIQDVIRMCRERE